MGRSNTLPISRPQPQDKTYRAPARSTTAQSPPSSTTASKIHNVLPHLPFHTSHPSSSTQRTPTPPRPGAPNRQNSVQTRYMDMLLALDTIPRLHNILASFFTWILLAGFVIFPGTFTSLSTSDKINGNHTAAEVLKSIKHVQLLVIAGVCCGIGAGGMIWLWWRWRENFVWLLNKIFMPGCLNSLAGLISTLTNVYSQQGGSWSITARVTAIVSGAIMVITGCLFVIYNFWVLAGVKKRHGREMDRGYGEEGLKEKIGRKMNEPALEPSSVV
ncbi:hypothetical protein BGZ57DRAFT_909417 [Hyaloscypha finlandica]|nr:hypothetical protein BGZ57DRAFT_909417 [Hyaloscypha finlandica]KAH8760830.1 hypothetical protein F5882DRAFT_416400 [Hyaloscypha sp. PMI_1271]